MADCPSCGRPVRLGATFCGGCGANLTAVVPVHRAPAVAPGYGSTAPARGPRPAFVPQAPQSPAPYIAPAAYPPPPAYPAPAAYPPPSYSPAGQGLPAGSIAAAAARGHLMSWNGQPLSPAFANKKVVAGIMGILFGQFGVHKFILGYTGAGIAMLVISLVSYLLIITVLLALVGGIGLIAISVIGLIEGIMYLTKSDDEFIQSYGVHNKSWF